MNLQLQTFHYHNFCDTSQQLAIRRVIRFLPISPVCSRFKFVTPRIKKVLKIILAGAFCLMQYKSRLHSYPENPCFCDISLVIMRNGGAFNDCNNPHRNHHFQSESQITIFQFQITSNISSPPCNINIVNITNIFATMRSILSTFNQIEIVFTLLDIRA